MIETIIIEDVSEMDLGNAQAAYDSYPEHAAHRKTAAENYKTAVEQIRDKDPATISPMDIEQVNSLYEDFEKADHDFQDTVAVLDRKFEELAMKAKELTGDLAYLQSRNQNNSQDLDWAKECLDQGFTLRRQKVIEAIGKAYQSHECLLTLKEEQNNTWLNKHVQNIECLK